MRSGGVRGSSRTGMEPPGLYMLVCHLQLANKAAPSDENAEALS